MTGMDKSAYEKKIIVQESDIDDLNHVNNLAYLNWVLDVAKDHWFNYVSKELHDQVIWVVLSHFIEYKRPCFLGEELTVKTQVAEIDGAKWPRNVWIYRPDGKLAVQAVTEWCLMDRQSMRPKRITEEVSSVFIS